MATSPSLFGGSLSPQEMQSQLLNQRAAQFAQLDPNQRLGMMAYKAGANLGTGLAGAFGVDVQDPMIQRATKLRELAGQYNTNTAQGLRQMADALRTQDPDMALQLSQRAAAMELEAAKLSSEQALASQRGREKEAADPFQKLVEQGKYTPESLAKYRDSKNPADLVLATKESKTSYGAEADRAAKANYGKDFSDLTQAEAKVIDSLLETRGVTKAKASASKTDVVLPGVAKAGDVTGLRKDVQAITKPYQDQSDAAESAIELADMAIKDNNFAAVSSLSRSLAKAAGETQLSRNDVQAFGIDPSLVGSVTDTVARLAKGRPTVDTLNKLKQLAMALKKKADSRIKLEEDQTIEVARSSGQFTEDQLNTVFRRRPASGGNVKTEFTSVKDAEAAKLPKGTIITINGRRAVVE
jgi:hypothetical protein